MASPILSDRPSKLLAEWFWTDRWIGSSAFLLPIEPRGLYREMLTQAWRRGGSLPNDPIAIQRAVGCTASEWRRCWPQIERYWRIDGDSLAPVDDDIGGSKPIAGQAPGRPHIPLEIRRAVFERDKYACMFCGAEQRLELDHIQPFCRGGPDTFENLRILCKTCNVRRGAPES